MVDETKRTSAMEMGKWRQKHRVFEAKRPQDMVLISADPTKELDENKLREISQQHDDKPILIKQGEYIKVYGTPAGSSTKWKVSTLDAPGFDRLPFPALGAPEAEYPGVNLKRDMQLELAKQGHLKRGRILFQKRELSGGMRHAIEWDLVENRKEYEEMQKNDPKNNDMSGVSMLGTKFPKDDTLYEIKLRDENNKDVWLNQFVPKSKKTFVHVSHNEDGSYNVQVVPFKPWNRGGDSKMLEFLVYKEKFGLTHVNFGLPQGYKGRAVDAGYLADNLLDRMKELDKVGLAMNIDKATKESIIKHHPAKWQKIERQRKLLAENRLQRDMLLKTDVTGHSIERYIDHIKESGEKKYLATEFPPGPPPAGPPPAGKSSKQQYTESIGAGKTGEEKLAAFKEQQDKLEQRSLDVAGASAEIKEIAEAFDGLFRKKEKVKAPDGTETDEERITDQLKSPEDIAKMMSEPPPAIQTRGWLQKTKDALFGKSERIAKDPELGSKAAEKRFDAMRVKIDTLVDKLEKERDDIKERNMGIKDGLENEIRQHDAQIAHFEGLNNAVPPPSATDKAANQKKIDEFKALKTKAQGQVGEVDKQVDKLDKDLAEAKDLQARFKTPPPALVAGDNKYKYFDTQLKEIKANALAAKPPSPAPSH
jgi:hypothetical protein